MKMPNVKVKYLNVYYSITRKAEETIKFDGQLTLGELLAGVCRSYASKLRELVLDENNQLKPHTWIMINKEREKNLQRELKDGDVVVFSLPIVGG
jgi:molybdopterin converting factor small subunit